MYKRRQPIEELQTSTSSAPNTSLEITPSKDSTTISSTSQPQLELLDLDLPIAFRKYVRTCTKHLLASYLSYHYVSPQHQSFLTSLDAITILKSVEEVVKDHN